jgi:hypothetical protein
MPLSSSQNRLHQQRRRRKVKCTIVMEDTTTRYVVHLHKVTFAMGAHRSFAPFCAKCAELDKRAAANKQHKSSILAHCDNLDKIRDANGGKVFVEVAGKRASLQKIVSNGWNFDIVAGYDAQTRALIGQKTATAKTPNRPTVCSAVAPASGDNDGLAFASLSTQRRIPITHAGPSISDLPPEDFRWSFDNDSLDLPATTDCQNVHTLVHIMLTHGLFDVGTYRHFARRWREFGEDLKPNANGFEPTTARGMHASRKRKQMSRAKYALATAMMLFRERVPASWNEQCDIVNDGHQHGDGDGDAARPEGEDIVFRCGGRRYTSLDSKALPLPKRPRHDNSFPPLPPSSSK